MSAFYPFRGGGDAQSEHCLLFLPFFLYDGFPKYEFVRDTFTDEEKMIVRRAIQDFEQEITSVYPPLKKCISFLEEDPSRPGLRVKVIGPKEATSCSSFIGFWHRL